MALNLTRGSTLIVPQAGARGGLRLDTTAAEIDLRSIRALTMWLDGESLVGESAGRLDLVERVGGRKGYGENGFGTALAEGPGDRLAFQLADQEFVRAIFDGVAILPVGDASANGFFMMAVVKPANGSVVTRPLVFSAGTAGTLSLIEWQMSQPAVDSPLTMLFRLNGSGKPFATVGGIPHSQRVVVWASYDVRKKRLATGFGSTVAFAVGTDVLAPVTGMVIGGRYGTGLASQRFPGGMEMLLLGNQPIWSPEPDKAENRLRADILANVTAITGL